MNKLDLRKELKPFYAPSAKEVQLIQIPRFKFIMVDGEIEAGQEPQTSTTFHEAMMALYGASFTLKFMSKLRKENPIDYPVMALEGLWWVKGEEFDINRKDNWRWTLMMLQPEHITEEMFREALAQLEKKRPSQAVSRLRLAEFEEGLCMQILHLGPYSAELATVEKMKAYARQHGYRRRGKHHEIYLGDPRRAKPENLKTILRQPVESGSPG